MNTVLVVDTERRPLDPIHPGRARVLLTHGKAAVLRRYPFTIVLVAEGPPSSPEPLRLKIDPGSRITGLALINDRTGVVAWAAELSHHGHAIRDALTARRSIRRGRRSRKPRHRKPRCLNRRRVKGWLPPSLESRIANVLTWVGRMRQLAPVGAISMELVRFDTQMLENAEISGVAYQQGELRGYEVKQYLLDKWGRRCAYCGSVGVPMQVEHIVPKVRGGSDRVSNLTLACGPCNNRKGARTAAQFGFPLIQAQARHSLRDLAAVNATRWVLHRRLCLLGLPVETGTGGRTKWGLPTSW